MSIELMGKCWKRLDLAGAELLLAVALADFANDDGTSIWPSVATLADKTRQDPRTVRRQLRRLESCGWLIAVDRSRGGRYRTTEYRVAADWVNGGVLPGFPDRIPKHTQASRRHKTRALDTRNPDKALPANSSGSVITHHSSFDDLATEGAARRRVHATVNGLSAMKRLKP